MNAALVTAARANLANWAITGRPDLTTPAQRRGWADEVIASLDGKQARGSLTPYIRFKYECIRSLLVQCFDASQLAQLDTWVRR